MSEKRLDEISIKEEILFVKSKIDKMLGKFTHQFQSPTTANGIYEQIDNIEWTTSFFTGMLWLIYEETHDEKYMDVLKIHMASFKERAEKQIATNTHDIGFLYSLSCMPSYILNGDTDARDTCIKAADLLITRYFDKAGILQAWGNLNDPNEQGRMIIDCNMNLPLLYKASEMTGDKKYYDIAYSHVKQAQKYIIRDDDSTFHTYYMDVETGEPKYGKTAQGYKDDSCWARGQAWAVYGFMLSYIYTGDTSLLESAVSTANYYLDRLPDDGIHYWDLSFSDGDLTEEQERDSSASVIFVCGILEMLKHLPITNEYRKPYEDAVQRIMKSLKEQYTSRDMDNCEGILLHGVYNKNKNEGVDECMSWGDYYYLEALVRMTRDWKLYW